MIEWINHLLNDKINVEINEELLKKNDNSNIKHKTSMIRSSLCGYSDAYIPVKEAAEVPNTVDAGPAGNDTNKKVIFKNCASFTSSIIEINNT